MQAHADLGDSRPAAGEPLPTGTERLTKAFLNLGSGSPAARLGLPSPANVSDSGPLRTPNQLRRPSLKPAPRTSAIPASRQFHQQSDERLGKQPPERHESPRNTQSTEQPEIPS